MPELPEVEVVRSGLARWVLDTTIAQVEVRHPRPVRGHLAGPDDFARQLVGTRILDAVRRGKFLWLTLDSGDALLAHLGMSGQLVLEPPEAELEKHLRVRIELSGGTGRELRFIDQRMFGGLACVPLVPTPDGGPGGLGAKLVEPLVPGPVAHIARDALDPELDEKLLVQRLRRRKTGVKRALLDQGLVSGIGNIYADEALWQAKVHYARPTETLTRSVVDRVLTGARAVMSAALAAGGTSFDSLYVDVNGSSGYFERSLAVYGRAGLPCLRCGTQVRRESFMNRSSHFCPTCQPRPRNPRW